MKKVLYILAAVVMVVLNVTPVLAATTAIVTIIGVPSYSGGILTFNVTYVSDTEMDLSWTYDAVTVSNVMVRAKYGSYPANPPNSSTAPSDGYLVYYGSDLSAVDTSMDMNQNAGTLYYSAWAQHPDGSWYVVASTHSEESERLVMIGMIVLALGITLAAWAMKDRVAKMLFHALGIIIWLVFAYVMYNQTYPGNTYIPTAMAFIGFTGVLIEIVGLITVSISERKQGMTYDEEKEQNRQMIYKLTKKKDRRWYE